VEILAKEQSYLSPEESERIVREQLQRDGFIHYDGYEWNLTEKGKAAVNKELDRYAFKPGLQMMLGMHYAELLGVSLF